jgi:hypothetical protein
VAPVWVCAIMARLFTAVVFLLALATQAHAQGLRLLPPEEFDRPYDGDVIYEAARDQDHVRALCRGMNFNLGVALGCSRVIMGVCYIIKVPDAEIRAVGHDPDVFMRHEMGHCNGWPAIHRGAR